MKCWTRIALLLATCLLTSCNGSSGDDIVLTQDRNGETIEIANRSTFAIQLAGNPTTGYEWTVSQADPAFLRLVESTYAPDSSSIGSGGLYTFRFETLQPGTTPLALLYRRSWETTPSDQTFTLTLRIPE